MVETQPELRLPGDIQRTASVYLPREPGTTSWGLLSCCIGSRQHSAAYSAVPAGRSVAANAPGVLAAAMDPAALFSPDSMPLQALAATAATPVKAPSAGDTAASQVWHAALLMARQLICGTTAVANSGVLNSTMRGLPLCRCSFPSA